MANMHDVDYGMVGDMQFVEVEFDAGEAAVAEAGGMGARQRLLTGESLFMTVFVNRSPARRRVAFGAPYPGKILAVRLGDVGGELFAQKGSFLAAARGVRLGIAFQKHLGAGLLGGEGFILQRLQGDVFVHAGGAPFSRPCAAPRESGSSRCP